MELKRRLTAELLAFVVWRLFPNVQLFGGGTDSLGFFYDFLFEQPLTQSMVELIEIELHRTIKAAQPIKYISMMRENAAAFFEHHRQLALAEQAAQEDSNILELIQIESFSDLCPTLPFTSTVEGGAIKLVKCIKSDDEITRLSGIVQPSSKELKTFLKTYERFLRKKDHRFLGPQLNLFSFHENGGVIWHPKGCTLRSTLQNWLVQQMKEMPQPIATASALPIDFIESDWIKQHVEFLRHFPFYHQDLPWRVMEYATVYHDLPEDQQWGLLSSNHSLMDLATLACEKRQLIPELISSLHFIEEIIKIFGFEIQWVLGVARDKGVEKEANVCLSQAWQELNRNFPSIEVREELSEIPQIELRICDVLGREWPASRLRIETKVPNLDYRVEEKAFSLTLLTRQVWGSLDRFIALLIEQCEGVLPFWLAPEQVRVMVIGEANRIYGCEVMQQMQARGLRVCLDVGLAKLGTRIHEAEKENVPYLVLIGEQERNKQRISVRSGQRFDQNQSMDLETFLNQICLESKSPTLRT